MTQIICLCQQQTYILLNSTSSICTKNCINVTLNENTQKSSMYTQTVYIFVYLHTTVYSIKYKE